MLCQFWLLNSTVVLLSTNLKDGLPIFSESPSIALLWSWAKVAVKLDVMLVTGLFSAFVGDMVAAVFVFLQFSVHQESNSYLNELKCYNSRYKLQ